MIDISVWQRVIFKNLRTILDKVFRIKPKTNIYNTVITQEKWLKKSLMLPQKYYSELNLKQKTLIRPFKYGSVWMTHEKVLSTHDLFWNSKKMNYTRKSINNERKSINSTRKRTKTFLIKFMVERRTKMFMLF